MINIFIGYDPREAICYSVCSNSILRNATVPLTISPLNLKNLPMYQETHSDGSTEFSYSRFLVPYLMDYQGWAIFLDGDMVVNSDIRELVELADPTKSVMCVQHNYQTKASIKFLNSTNRNYKRKNWSSVVLYNCAHPSNRILTPSLIESSTGTFLHQFAWLADDEIGGLPKEWNWLADEYGENDQAKLVHYTLGAPCFEDYKNTPMADRWFKELSYVNIQ